MASNSNILRTPFGVGQDSPMQRQRQAPTPGEVLDSYTYHTRLLNDEDLIITNHWEKAMNQMKKLHAKMDESDETILLAFRQDFKPCRSVFGAVLRVWKDQADRKTNKFREKYGDLLIELIKRLCTEDNDNREVQAMMFLDSINTKFEARLEAVKDVRGIGTKLTGVILRLLDSISPIGRQISIDSPNGTYEPDRLDIFRRTCGLVENLAEKVPLDSKYLLKWDNREEHGESGDIFLAKKYSKYLTKRKTASKNYIQACTSASLQGNLKPRKPDEINTYEILADHMVRLQFAFLPKAMNESDDESDDTSDDE